MNVNLFICLFVCFTIAESCFELEIKWIQRRSIGNKFLKQGDCEFSLVVARVKEEERFENFISDLLRTKEIHEHNEFFFIDLRTSFLREQIKNIRKCLASPCNPIFD